MIWLGYILAALAVIHMHKTYGQRVIAAAYDIHRKKQKYFLFLGKQDHLNHAEHFFKGMCVISFFFLALALTMGDYRFFFVSVGIYLYLPKGMLAWNKRQRIKQFERQLVFFISSISQALKAGHTIEHALEHLSQNSAAPLSYETQVVLKHMHLGHTFEKSFFELTQRMPIKDLTAVYQAMSISLKLGTSLAQVMDHIERNVKEKEKIRQKINTLTSQSKMQAWVIGMMPFLVLVSLEWIAPGYTEPLFQHRWGVWALIYGLTSITLGVLWIFKLTHKRYL